jgi:hypothetical protein
VAFSDGEGSLGSGEGLGGIPTREGEHEHGKAELEPVTGGK